MGVIGTPCRYMCDRKNINWFQQILSLQKSGWKIFGKLKSVILTQKGCKKFNPEKILLQLLLSDLHSITAIVQGAWNSRSNSIIINQGTRFVITSNYRKCPNYFENIWPFFVLHIHFSNYLKLLIRSKLHHMKGKLYIMKISLCKTIIYGFCTVQFL